MGSLSVPIIDISALGEKSPSKEKYKKLLKELAEACENWGFFYIVNHGVDLDFIATAKKLGTNFFEKPKEYKQKVARGEDNLQGWSDSELTKQKVDWKQIFDFTDETPKDILSRDIGVHGQNQWPDIPKFEQTMMKYLKEMQKLSRTLMRGILATLTNDAELIVEQSFEKGEDTSLCRLNYYPICPNPETHLGVGPHSDPGIVTVLLQDDTVTSLQVLKDGKFYDVPPVPNSFVINIGDMMQVFSNGKYKGPVHRVLANHTQARFSLPYFLAPSYSYVVEPLKETISTERPLKYKPIPWGDFRRARYEGDYADKGEEIQITHFEI